MKPAHPLLTIALLAAALPLASPSAQAAVKRWPAERGVVYDNGAAVRGSSAAAVVEPYSNADDFVLSGATRVTGFEWNVAEAPVGGTTLAYIDTTVSILAATAEGRPGTVLYSTDLAATRTVWAGATPRFAFDSVRYKSAGLAIDLAPGSYFFAVTQHYADPLTVAYFVEAGGSRPAGTQDGSYFETPTTAGGWLTYEEDNSFRVFGAARSSADAVPAVPEPGTALLWIAGAAALCAWPRARRGALPSSAT